MGLLEKIFNKSLKWERYMESSAPLLFLSHPGLKKTLKDQGSMLGSGFGKFVDNLLQPILDPMSKIAGKKISKPWIEANKEFKAIYGGRVVVDPYKGMVSAFGEKFPDMTKHKQKQVLNIMKEFYKENAVGLENRIQYESLSGTYKK